MAKENKQYEYVISACLLGIPCRWNNKGKLRQEALNAFYGGRALLVCPEIMAGLPTPRPACEITGGDGHDVIESHAQVVDKDGNDYTEQFLKGAKQAVDLVKQLCIRKAILKSGSPTCGAGSIYNGDFTGKKKDGVGVFAALLHNEGIETVELD